MLTSDQFDRLVGLAMLAVATFVFLYYTIWTLLMVRLPAISLECVYSLIYNDWSNSRIATNTTRIALCR